jgi:hypothetical protein
MSIKLSVASYSSTHDSAVAVAFMQLGKGKFHPICYIASHVCPIHRQSHSSYLVSCGISLLVGYGRKRRDDEDLDLMR